MSSDDLVSKFQEPKSGTVAKEEPATGRDTQGTETKRYFRFRSVSQFLYNEILERYIYFATPKSFNDPFEFTFSQDNLDDVVLEMFSNMVESRNLKPDGETVRQVKGQMKAALLKSLLEKYDDMQSRGLCCFTGTNDNVLLWGHYANGHRGVCLEYDKALFETGKAIEVRYSDTPPRLYAKGEEIDTERWFKEFVATKSIDWKYEQEVRLIHEKGNHRSHIAPNQIVRAYFGLETQKTDADSIARALRFIHPNIKFSVARRVDSKYRVRFEDVDLVD